MPPGNNSLGRGRRFFKNHPNERRLGQQQITSKKVLRQEKTKAGGRRFSPSPTTVLLCKPRVQICLTHQTTRHLEGCTKTAPRRMHITRHLEGCTKTAPRRMHITRHLEGCTSQGTSKGAQNTSPRRMHSKESSQRMPDQRHLEGCTQRGSPKDTQ